MSWLDRIYLIVVALFATGASTLPLNGQTPPTNYSTEARLLKKSLVDKHFMPRAIDNSYSAWVFDNTIDKLDPERLYFSNDDLEPLRAYREKIDDDLNGYGWTFLPELTRLYRKVLLRYKGGVTEISTQPIDFFSEAFFKKDSVWVADEKLLPAQWKLAFRYHTQQRLADLIIRTGAGSDKDGIVKNEKIARAQAKKVLLREVDRTLNRPEGFESYVASELMRSMAAAFDPHTDYFSSNQIETWMDALSSEGFYFGFTLGENEDGEVIIEQLLPGGPAWNSGEIHQGDVLQAIRWDGKELEDLWGIGMDEANDLLNEPEILKIELTIRKTDGTVKVISLRKEKVTSEENIVKSFVLQGEHKIGFISLPGFYSNWGDENGSKCAMDVAREIVKLKKENIEGLILDVRFNGGGSMAEAVAMAGIFIDAGPVGLRKPRNEEAHTVKDLNRGTIYDGPLVIMVNSLSASASEFLAAAMQDYNRALIVGGRTYGKATAQQLMPTDPSLSIEKMKLTKHDGKIQTIGFAMVTVDRLYRITGKTAQLTGVKPDVELPDALQPLQISERKLPLAFPSDSIQKKVYYQPLTNLPRMEIAKKSKIRIEEQAQFRSLKNAGVAFADHKRKSGTIALRWADFQRDNVEYSGMLREISVNSKISNHVFEAGFLKDEQLRMQSNPYIGEFNNSWIKRLEEDIFVNETFLITCDLISHVTKK